MTLRHPKILIGSADLAIFLDEHLHDVIHGIKLFGILVHRPHIERVDVVAGLRLRLGRHGDGDLVADGGQEVEVHIDLVLFRPGADHLAHRFVSGRDPMVPQGDAELAGGPGGPDIDQGKRRCRRPQPQRLTTCESSRHGLILPASSAFCLPYCISAEYSSAVSPKQANLLLTILRVE